MLGKRKIKNSFSFNRSFVTETAKAFSGSQKIGSDRAARIVRSGIFETREWSGRLPCLQKYLES
jgi:hypothetical protein